MFYFKFGYWISYVNPLLKFFNNHNEKEKKTKNNMEFFDKDPPFRGNINSSKNT